MRRDRITFAIMLGIPIVQLTIFGFAVNTVVDHIPLVVCDQSQSGAGRELVDRLVNTTFFDLAGRAETYDAASKWIARDDAKAALLIPPDFPEQRKRGTAQVGMLVDASDPLLAQGAISTAAQLGQVLNIEILQGEVFGSAPVRWPVDVRIRALYNPNLDSPTYIVPGLIGVILTMTMVLITAAAIVRERERGTLESLITTPVTKTELMLGKIFPYIVVGYVQMTFVLLIGLIVFGVKVHGSLLLLYGVGFLFIVASLGVGMVLSTIGKNQLQTMQMAFFFFLPNILLSGFMFPIASMPWIIQKFSHILPLTYFLVVLRGIVLKGTGFADLWSHIWPLLIFAPAIVSLGILKFSKKLS
ncbi:MAG: ABC transporter permease [candidate division Zixibacteria bacterium]|nr:ABC transporter permease [candidate division Zixibacteria bacterium]